MKTVYLAVIGGSSVSSEIAALAREVGREVARRGAVLLCGGLGGVMAAAAQGAKEAGGVSLGILPDADRRRANPYLTYTIATNLGHARNVLLAHCSRCGHRGGRRLRQHLGGRHRPQTGQTRGGLESRLGPAAACSGPTPPGKPWTWPGRLWGREKKIEGGGQEA